MHALVIDLNRRYTTRVRDPEPVGISDETASRVSSRVANFTVPRSCSRDLRLRDYPLASAVRSFCMVNSIRGCLFRTTGSFTHDYQPRRLSGLEEQGEGNACESETNVSFHPDYPVASPFRIYNFPVTGFPTFLPRIRLTGVVSGFECIYREL